MKKSNFGLSLVISLGFLGGTVSFAQTPASSPLPKTTPTPAGVALAQNNSSNQGVSRERRQQAYAKLLEAQRYIWGTNRMRSQVAVTTAYRMAKQALQKAVELDPTLAEGYTALAEISLTAPGDIEEAIMLSDIAIKLNPDNFGAHKILARVYTIKSRLNNEPIDPAAAQKAIAEWREVARLDPRNAEAWAFLSEFYAKTNKNQERVDALRKWMSSSAALENRFYRIIMGAQENLSPENASLKLGEALVETGQTTEAVEILSRAVADAPENVEAVELLRRALTDGKAQSTNATLESLQQAVFANQANTVLVDLLAGVQVRMGKTDDAVKTLKSSIQNNSSDKNSVANLQVSLGDIYIQANRPAEAITAYEDSLKTFGITNSPLTTEEEREFATKVFEKMIQAYKTSGKVNEARATIERARLVLGNSELFSDKQLVSLLRETGKKNEALQAVREMRKKNPEDYSLLRLEASMLTEMGKVDEGVTLVKSLITSSGQKTPSPYYDNFSNYLFISGLYSQANRSNDAILSARQAQQIAENNERRQIAELMMATAQNQAGDFKNAETTLRKILRETPENPIALNNLGYFLLERGEKMDEAYALIQKALKIDPKNPSYLDSLGWANFKLGKLDESERLLKEALLLNPSSPNVYEHLGDVYEKQGKMELAKEAWQKALLLSDNSQAALRLKSKIQKNN